MKNHIPLSKELRNSSKTFFRQIYSNPDSMMLKMNMKYFSQLARQDILNAMCSDFQMTSEEIQKLIIKVSIDTDKSKFQKDKPQKKIYFIRKRSILTIETAKKVLDLIKEIDNFPVYIQVDFINPEGLSLICKNSTNTHLFSLYYLESVSDFKMNVSKETQSILL